jgi:hypothetical protein
MQIVRPEAFFVKANATSPSSEKGGAPFIARNKSITDGNNRMLAFVKEAVVQPKLGLCLPITRNVTAASQLRPGPVNFAQ